jgi:hypothetical protein
MDTEKIIFFSIAIVFLLIGLITMITGQLYLLSKISKWNAMKAYISISPFFLLLFLKFDNQDKIICRNYPMYMSYLKSGLVITLTGAVSLLLTAYL